MAQEVVVRRIEPQPVASIRLVTTPAELGARLGEALPEVWACLERQGLHPAGPPFARYLVYGDDEVELDAGFPVSAPAADEGRVVAGELPGGPVAATWHVGPYETLNQTHVAMVYWLREHGHAPAGAPWEIYWTDPEEVPNPDEWRTEVIWPIE